MLGTVKQDAQLEGGRQEWALGILRSLEASGRQEVEDFLHYLRRRQRGPKQSGFKELMQLRVKVGKLQRENEELLLVCKEMNEFRSVLDTSSVPSSIDERRLLLLKSQIIAMRRQTSFLQKSVHSQNAVLRKTRELLRFLAEAATLTHLQVAPPTPSKLRTE